MRRTVFVLVCLLVLSGCNTLSEPSGTTTETLTPVDVPTTPEGPAPQIAPGITATGVERVSVLAAAHDESLQNQSYTRYLNETARYANGTVRAQFNLTARVTADRSRISIDVHQRFPPSTEAEESSFHLWATDDRAFSRLQTPNGTVYRNTSRSERAGIIQAWTRVDTRFTTEFSARDMSVRAGQGGENRYVLTANASTPLPGRLSEGLESPASGNAVAIIGPDGRIYGYHVRYRTTTVSEDGAGETPDVTDITVLIDESVRFEEIGSTTVERPSWYENATDGDG